MSGLTVKDVRERKTALEKYIADAIKGFESETGVSVSGLHLNLIHISSLWQQGKETLPSVSVTIEI